MSVDLIEHIDGSLVQHGHHNDRVYLMHLGSSDIEALIVKLDRLAQEQGYGKIFAKIPELHWKRFEEAGYRKEAEIPGFFRGLETALFVSKFLCSDREQADLCSEVRALTVAGSVGGEAAAGKAGSSQRLVCPCSTSDVQEMSSLYQQVFPTYPFPIFQPSYLEEMLDSGNRYFCIRSGGKMVALAGAEVAEAEAYAEMTDFATLPGWRGKGYAAALLASMEHTVRAGGIRTVFTIARAASRGMNTVFSKHNYRFAGFLRNNTQICGSIQSMTVWYKHLLGEDA